MARQREHILRSCLLLPMTSARVLSQDHASKPLTSIIKMASSMPPLPAHFKSLQHYLKTAQEHEQKFPVVSYYCRMYVLQKGMEMDKSSPEAKEFLLYMMGRLEEMKVALAHEEAIKSDEIASAHVEHYALKLFAHADTEDRAARHNKNVVKAFYNASLLFEVLSVFGPLNEDIEKYKKYARYKSAYINRCMKAGETPVPGPVDDEGQEIDIGSMSISSYMASREQGVGGNVSGEGGDSKTASGGYQPPAAANDHQPPVPAARGHQPPVAAARGHQPPAAASGHQPPAAASGHQPPAAAASSYQPPASSHVPPETSTDVVVDWDSATKFTKYAVSSLTYEDKEGAIEYLRKALNVLTIGHE